MITKSKIFMLILCMSIVVASCTNSNSPKIIVSPKKRYVSHMENVLKMITDTKENTESFFLTQIGPEQLPYLISDLINLSFVYSAAKEDLAKALSENKKLLEAVYQIRKNYVEIQIALGGIEVPLEISVAHQRVLECIDERGYSFLCLSK